jgi:hypothetical protein
MYEKEGIAFTGFRFGPGFIVRFLRQQQQQQG